MSVKPKTSAERSLFLIDIIIIGPFSAALTARPNLWACVYSSLYATVITTSLTSTALPSET